MLPRIRPGSSGCPTNIRVTVQQIFLIKERYYAACQESESMHTVGIACCPRDRDVSSARKRELSGARPEAHVPQQSRVRLLGGWDGIVSILKSDALYRANLLMTMHSQVTIRCCPSACWSTMNSYGAVLQVCAHQQGPLYSCIHQEHFICLEIGPIQRKAVV